MHTHPLAPTGALASLIAALTLLSPSSAQTQEPPTPGFLPNQGQWSSAERYRLRVPGMDLFLQDDGWSFWVRESSPSDVPGGARPKPRMFDDETSAGGRATALRMSFVGARAERMVAEQPRQGVQNFLVGDATRHRRGIHSYDAVRYEQLLPGIDVRTRIADGQFEYDLLLAAGADLSQALIQVDGAERLELTADGSLILHTPLGPLSQPRPTTWSVEADGTRTPVLCDYVLHGASRFGFTAPDHDPARPLVVDPPLLYASYVGGSLADEPSWISHDSQGRMLLAGFTRSTNLPTTPGALQTNFGGVADGYLMCIDPTQPAGAQVVFQTYFGGNDNDWTSSITEVPGIGYAFSGRTASTNLPTTSGVLQPNMAAGAPDAFVGILDPTGNSIVALTYLGGSGPDLAYTVHPHPNGQLLLSGITLSSDFPTTPNAMNPTQMGGPNAGQDVWLAMIDPALSTLSWSTYAGGTGDDWGYAADIDTNGQMLVIYGTDSRDLKTTPTAVAQAFGRGFSSSWWSAECGIQVIQPLAAPNQQVAYGTYLGGIWNERPFRGRFANGGDLVIAGSAQSIDFPTTPDAVQPTHAGGSFVNQNYVAGDAFVTRIDPSTAGTAGLRWSTFLGGPAQDQGVDVDIDPDGSVTLVGWSQITRNVWPSTPNALRRTYGQNDGFVVHLSADGRQVYYSSLLGGTNLHDGAWLAESQAAGVMDLGLATNSSNFPVTANAHQPNHGGGNDAVVVRFDLIPDGTTRYGSPTRGTAGFPTIHAMGDATPGNANFGIACSKAAASSPGVLLVGSSSTSATPLLGVDLYVNVLGSIALTVASDARGEHMVPLALPTMALGPVFAQYVWVESTSPLSLSASDAMQF